MIGGVPLWVFIIILLIFFSGYMAFRAINVERKHDKKFIEQEGQIYMERMQKEKEARTTRKRERNA